MPEMGYQPTNKYLPPRPGKGRDAPEVSLQPVAAREGAGRFLRWVDRVLSR
jgi:hypothetical protein